MPVTNDHMEVDMEHDCSCPTVNPPHECCHEAPPPLQSTAAAAAPPDIPFVYVVAATDRGRVHIVGVFTEPVRAAMAADAHMGLLGACDVVGTNMEFAGDDDDRYVTVHAVPLTA